MDPDRIAVATDQIDALICREFLVGNQIINVDDTILAREVTCTSVEDLEEGDVVLTSAYQHSNLQDEIDIISCMNGFLMFYLL
jgi:hypothetical protein